MEKFPFAIVETEMDEITIVLAEDHNVVRQGLKSLIQEHSDLRVIGEAADGHEAYDLIQTLNPEVVVFDISMPVMNGIELLEKVIQKSISSRMLALTANEDRAYLQQVIRMGVSGYLFKRSAAEELILAIRTVAQGQKYLDPAIVGDLVQDAFVENRSEVRRAHETLSSREEEVLGLLSQGFTNKEVASKLDVSVKTVETHKARGMLKIGLRSRAELIRYAISCGWLAKK